MDRSQAGTSEQETVSPKIKPRTRGKKRKRPVSNSSSDDEAVLPDNTLEVEKNLHASAVKNNLDDISVKKILKKVVTNDHVLALVKLREEEMEACADDTDLKPKLTRSKAKELLKQSPESAPWNLQLDPIKEIPVKTRPEVKALISQELQEDEEDEEYRPTQEDAQSDDDQTLESMSDMDSQPRTPATPLSVHADSPRVTRDGPFKVPTEVKSVARRKLDVDQEEPTIALRTRSKINLSETSIEHIESTFVPPDDLPNPDVDDLWSQFLSECLDPKEGNRHEDDDDADPEYNVAADPDAHDEDEEALESSIIKISKKELNDLVTELFNIMPETTAEEGLAELADKVLSGNATEMPRWDGKVEPLSDEEAKAKENEKADQRIKYSVGKTEPGEIDIEEHKVDGLIDTNQGNSKQVTPTKVQEAPTPRPVAKPTSVAIIVEESSRGVSRKEARAPTAPHMPPALRQLQAARGEVHTLHITIDQVTMLPEQIQILQQQLRQHVQLATSNFMQLFVNPNHWTLAPIYKQFLESLKKMMENYPDSVVGVCNLAPAVELVNSWESSLSADTPENTEYVTFMQDQAERVNRRSAANNFYMGDFHPIFKQTVANSPVFLYPYLLPPMPYRPVMSRKNTFSRAEDLYLTLGLDEFWDYVDANPQIYKVPKRPSRHRWGLCACVELVVAYMLPWMESKAIHRHLQHVRRNGHEDNPINKFFKERKIDKVEHVLLPFNPKLTLYEQPENEVPNIWVRYLARTSTRFREYYGRRNSTKPSNGVKIDIGTKIEIPTKAPLPINFTQQLGRYVNSSPIVRKKPSSNRLDVDVASPSVIVSTTKPVIATNMFKIVETSTGAFLVPINTLANTEAISTAQNIEVVASNLPENSTTGTENLPSNQNHCKCCVLLKQIVKERQTLLTEFFRSNRQVDNGCECYSRKYPKVTKRLKMLVKNFRNNHTHASTTLAHALARFKPFRRVLGIQRSKEEDSGEDEVVDIQELAYVTSYQLKLFAKTGFERKGQIKAHINTLLSNFDIHKDDPIKLATHLREALGDGHRDLYLDFLCFLTPVQADRMDQFKEYFTRTCVVDLIRNVKEHVKDKAIVEVILSQIQNLFSVRELSSCNICYFLLASLKDYPKLAKHVFSLFPHKYEDRQEKIEQNNAILEKIEMQKRLDSELREEKSGESSSEEDLAVEYNSDGDANETGNNNQRQIVNKEVTNKDINGEQTNNQHVSNKKTNDEEISNKETNNLDACDKETDDHDVSDQEINDQEIKEEPEEELEEDSVRLHYSDSEMSDTEASERREKFAPTEWQRDEDKLILEILMAQLSPEERRGKTILELIDEKNIILKISSQLSHKSDDKIKERLLMLLQYACNT